ncbi:MAG TPA: dTDP-4-dehydrorhamnose 3,5-epimerase, partial [Chitinophagaceae bacterium]|nr:dTDP-4-dehydrorhamnose 3,5-epimerase [Chitinophagaceae bacterium]
KKFTQLSGIDIDFVQDNQAKSNFGILRGLHFQKGEHAQAKLVSVIKGRVIDIAVDIRPESSTYLQHIAIELSELNHLQLFVPRGFAHGYSVLEDNTIFFYKCDNFYHKDAEGGIIYNDPSLQIDWQLKPSEMILSEKDQLLPTILG